MASETIIAYRERRQQVYDDLIEDGYGEVEAELAAFLTM